MTDILKIIDHTVRALNRSTSPFRGKPRHEAFISAVVKQIQELEDALHDMIDARALANAVGKQLDNIGTLVDQARQGYDDDFYRILLYVKIGQNTSQGGGEKLISIYKLLTGASVVHYQDLGGGSVSLGSDVPLEPGLINFVYDNMEKVAAGGVRVDALTCFDPVKPFRFSGPNTDVPSAGFSDITGNTGGKLAIFHRRKVPFSFAGNNNDTGGFGSVLDPRVGGVLAGIGG